MLEARTTETVAVAHVAQVCRIVLIVVSMFVGLFSRPLTEPDEGRNAEVAREMALSGDWFLPHLDSLPYVDKPLVYFVMVADTFRTLGVSAATARLPSFIATLATGVLVAALGLVLFGGATGLRSLELFLISPLVWTFAQIVILDALFMFWVVAAIGAFYFAIARASEPPHQSRRWSIVAWAAITAAIATKGPVGLLLPLVVMVPYAVRCRALRLVFDPVGIFPAAALIALWVGAMEHRLPGFLSYVVFTETLGRLTSDKLHRGAPFWYFVPILLVGALPASLLFLTQARAMRSAVRESPSLFLLLWLVLPFVAFSLFRSKLPHYMLPLIPPLALIAAARWTRDPAWRGRALRVVSAFWMVIGVLLLIVCALPALHHLSEPLRTHALWAATLTGACALLAGLWGWRTLAADPLEMGVLTVPLLLFYWAGLPLLGDIGLSRSNVDLANAIRGATTAPARVLGVRAFPVTLPFYLARPVELASPDGYELTSNYLIATHDHWFNTPYPLHPGDYWRSVLSTCPQPTIFVTQTADTETNRALVQAGLPLIARNDQYAAHGPCTATARSRE